MSIKFKVLCFLALFIVTAKAQEVFNYPLDTLNGEEVYRYEVERSIGLYRIGVNFNVTQDEIIRLNPQLRERGLRFGELLYIPTGREVRNEEVKDEGVKDEVVKDSVVAVTDTIIMPDAPRVLSGEVIELALLLPFESQQTKRSNNADRMLEFYQGALLALRDLQQDSLHFRLRVYDSERSELRVNGLCDSTELDSVQGILGLVYPIQIERMAVWCETHHVPLILPFSDDIDLSTHPQLLQFNSTDEQETDSICRWIAAQDSALHCVVVETRDADVTSFVRSLRKNLKAHEISTTGLALRDLMVDSANYALDRDRENLIILHSDRYQNVRILLPHLSKLQTQGYRLRIVSQYSWQKENIDLPQVYTSVFTAENGREQYDALWEKYFANSHVSDAPRFDLLGYDLMRALVKWVTAGNEQLAVSGLQSDITWSQVGNGGYQNAEVRIVVSGE